MTQAKMPDHPAWEVRSEPEADELMALVHDPDRRTPIVMVSVSKGEALIDAHFIADTLQHTAIVAVITGRIGHYVTSHYGDAVGVWGGAVRLFPPDHRVSSVRVYVAPDGDLDAVEDRIISWAQAHQGNGILIPDSASIPDQIAGTSDELVAAKTRAAQAEREARELRKENKALVAEKTELEDQIHGRGVYGDPEQQLRHEVVTAWLRLVPEPERERWALPDDYAFGPDFVPSVEVVAHIECPRATVVEAIINVLTGRAREINSMQVRPHTMGSSGTTSQLRREDGGVAFRANLQSAISNARRIRWWILPDGTIELHRVFTHDDDR